MNSLKMALSLSTMLLSQPAFCSAVLYNTNFDAPASPSYSTVFGSTQTVGPVLGNLTKSLAFNSAGNAPSFYYDQIQYNVDNSASPYYGNHYTNFAVSFDVATSGLIGSVDQFAVYFDTPTVRNLYFQGDGTIAVANYGSGASGVIGTYANNSWMHVDMKFDLADNRWDILLNHSLVYSDAMDASSLQSLRFSHGAVFADSIDYTATTYLDNVVISAVPAPATFLLMGSGLVMLSAVARRTSRKRI